jgi:hypothetical protein
MSSVRRRLRIWAAAWLVLQAVSLSVFSSGRCCQVQERTADKNASCHQTPTVPPCPMHAANTSAPCPMHATHANHDGCAMRGTCSAPSAAVVALLATHGVLTDASISAPVLTTTDVVVATTENLVSRLASPDAPPPRA